MHVIATAGHIDHGKSTLVRTLTGMEPDRWEEERRRGLTLDLGFVWFRPVPEGEPMAFVDVPGHERLVANMLAGVGPVPAVLFVVAADQGWQAQSQEHLSVLDALGVRHGVLAVTRGDLADPGPVSADAVRRIAASSLGTVEAVAVSAVTGRGIDELRSALLRLAGSLPAADPAADVRLWVDRAFTVRGHGTVVTGTLGEGTIRLGDRLTAANGQALRVRGMQALREDRTEVAGVARVAVNVHGPGAGAVRRGDALLTPGRWLTTGVVDVRTHGDGAHDLPRQLTLHVGSAAVAVTVRPLGHDTARLTLARELPLRLGDAALLRDPGGHRPPFGITVLDVRTPRLRRRGAAAARARELEGTSGLPDPAGELRRRGLVRAGDLEAMGAPAEIRPVAGDWLVDPVLWDRLRTRLVAAVEEHAEAHPLDPCLPTEEARRLLKLPDRLLVDALVASVGAPTLTQRDGRIHGTVRRPELPPAVRSAVDAVRKDLARSPFRAPEAARLTELGLGVREMAAAAAAGELLKVAEGIVLLPTADADAAGILAGLQQPFTLSEARRALDTTRRVAVPLMEHLDRCGWTERVDQTHRRHRADADNGSGGGRESNPPARDPRTPRF
ncbi:selenocysteine-specific translation elongation factor [Streptomyces camponoticapitis]|uniref:Selenocysteine-specific translation elongation factor n=1 Tax=Streptomyces camponoticapitis TaxID=1616125 RepID=A0ABQ2EMX9_9ACTN|nr:selenocysteine-specific translation elongation factor [Streptomyces camponoticapitis]